MYINKGQPMRLWLALPSQSVQAEQKQVVKSFGTKPKEPSSLGPRLFLGGSK